MDKLLELIAVTAGYEDEIALRNVNMVIRGGDFIGIIGPNGGGKTTLLKVILGQIRPFSGQIRYHFDDARQIQSDMGYLPQIINFDYRFPISVRDVVLSGLQIQKGLIKRFSRVEKDRAMMLLKRVGISHLADKAIGELSGGQKQRVFLCRALAADPKILILDEPDTFADNQFEHDLYEILKELNQQMAILMVSHDLGTISSYVKTIACVNKFLHYHGSNVITEQQLAAYDCPVQLIAHGSVPHTVLQQHKKPS